MLDYMKESQKNEDKLAEGLEVEKNGKNCWGNQDSRSCTTVNEWMD